MVVMYGDGLNLGETLSMNEETANRWKIDKKELHLDFEWFYINHEIYTWECYGFSGFSTSKRAMFKDFFSWRNDYIINHNDFVDDFFEI